MMKRRSWHAREFETLAALFFPLSKADKRKALKRYNKRPEQFATEIEALKFLIDTHDSMRTVRTLPTE